jgi:hypothetical protein
VFQSCQERSNIENKQAPLVSVKTTLIEQGDIENYVSFNGKTVYLKKNTIVSPIAGYIVKMNVKYGNKVQKNDVLFEIQTKEHKALENAGSLNINFSNIKVLASSDGTINELNFNETGGYVMEGSTLCSIVENKDLMVLVNVPFEYNQFLKTNLKCRFFLSDNSSFAGHTYNILPMINETDQTQKVLIQPETGKTLPENLNLLVRFVNENHISSYLIPKEALMTNETQTEFWIMKVLKGNLAIKVSVVKGLENDSLVEISSAHVQKNDLVIQEGAYGLSDSTLVNIIK